MCLVRIYPMGPLQLLLIQQAVDKFQFILKLKKNRRTLRIMKNAHRTPIDAQVIMNWCKLHVVIRSHQTTDVWQHDPITELVVDQEVSLDHRSIRVRRI